MPLVVRRRLSDGVPLWLVVILMMVVGGGSATAASKLITGKQIKDGSLTGKDIKDHSIGAKDLSKAIKLGNGTVVSGQGSDGAPGTNGTNGTNGTPGQNGTNAFGELVYKVAGPFDSNAGGLDSGSVDCGDGMKAIGGGAYGDADSGQSISASAPSTASGNVDPSRWQVWMNNGGGDSTFSVYAICARADTVTTP
ncbi:MAG: hypothetical protein QOJ07_619 [Thermoleophilaceae bacterium]|jgi:hypothetical protein|nr:hypothetical protein [Thermoleophilaceae bacterium]